MTVQPFFIGTKPVFPVEHHGEVVGIVHAAGNSWAAQDFYGNCEYCLTRAEAVTNLRRRSEGRPTLTLVHDRGQFLPDDGGPEAA